MAAIMKREVKKLLMYCIFLQVWLEENGDQATRCTVKKKKNDE